MSQEKFSYLLDSLKGYADRIPQLTFLLTLDYFTTKVVTYVRNFRDTPSLTTRIPHPTHDAFEMKTDKLTFKPEEADLGYRRVIQSEEIKEFFQEWMTAQKWSYTLDFDETKTREAGVNRFMVYKVTKPYRKFEFPEFRHDNMSFLIESYSANFTLEGNNFDHEVHEGLLVARGGKYFLGAQRVKQLGTKRENRLDLNMFKDETIDAFVDFVYLSTDEWKLKYSALQIDWNDLIKLNDFLNNQVFDTTILSTFEYGLLNDTNKYEALLKSLSQFEPVKELLEWYQKQHWNHAQVLDDYLKKHPDAYDRNGKYDYADVIISPTTVVYEHIDRNEENIYEKGFSNYIQELLEGFRALGYEIQERTLREPYQN